MAPLARQGDFYVPEVRQIERRLSEQEESHSDTEVSGRCYTLCLLTDAISGNGCNLTSLNNHHHNLEMIGK